MTRAHRRWHVVLWLLVAVVAVAGAIVGLLARRTPTPVAAPLAPDQQATSYQFSRTPTPIEIAP